MASINGRKSKHHKDTHKFDAQRRRTERNKLNARMKHNANHPNDQRDLLTGKKV